MLVKKPKCRHLFFLNLCHRDKGEMFDTPQNFLLAETSACEKRPGRNVLVREVLGRIILGRNVRGRNVLHSFGSAHFYILQRLNLFWYLTNSPGCAVNIICFSLKNLIIFLIFVGRIHEKPKNVF